MFQFSAQELLTNNSYKATIKGDIFQLKLLMACALRARNKGVRFLMNTEVIKTEKFDDLVIEYDTSATVVQAKHTSGGAIYKKSDLIKGCKGEASLAKYFDSYVNIRDMQPIKNKTINYIFFTNRNIKEDDLIGCFTDISEPDENIAFRTNTAKCKKFSDSFKNKIGNFAPLYQEFEQAIKQNSVVYYESLSKKVIIYAETYRINIEYACVSLVNKICGDLAIIYNTGVRLVNLKGVFAKERHLLISILEQENDNTYRFSDNFLKNQLTNSVTNKPFTFHTYFRTLLLTGLSRRFQLNESQVIYLLENTKIQLPNKPFTHVWDPAGLPNSVILTKNSSNNELIWTITVDQVYSIVGMFGEYHFAYNPEQNFPLCDLTVYNTLHEAILKAIHASGLINIAEVEQNFKNNVKEFFGVLYIKSGQPSEDELETLLKEEMKVSFKFSGDEYYISYQAQMLNWMKEFGGKWLTREDIELFMSKVSNGVTRLHLVGYSQHLMRFLHEHKLKELNHNIQNSITQFVTQPYIKSVCIIYGEDPLGQALITSKTIQQISDNGIYLKQDNWSFIDTECRIINKIVEGLSSHLELVVIDKADILLEKDIDQFRNIINTTILKKKKVILIVSTKSLSNLLELVPKENLIEHKFNLLDHDHIIKLSEPYLNKNLQIAGRNIKINSILAAKCGGIYNIMSYVSNLLPLLNSTKVDSPSLSIENSYIQQNVSYYLSYYTLNNIINNLLSNQILVIKSSQPTIDQDLLNQLNKFILITYDSVLKFYENLNLEDSYDNLLRHCITNVKDISKIKQEKTTLYIQSENPNLNLITDKLKLLRRNHIIIIITTVNQFMSDSFDLVHAEEVKINNAISFILPKDKRVQFNEPNHLKHDSSPVPYTHMVLSKRQLSNVSTCITANPGTGKSTSFTQLFKSWQNQVDLTNEYHWLIYINLNDIIDDFTQGELAVVLIKHIMRTLKIDLSLYDRILWTNILSFDLKNGFVKILFDGWDEVKDYRCTLCKTFIASLPPSVHFDIAMRPYILNNSPCRIYQLVDLQVFTDNDLNEYLTKRFTEKYRIISGDPNHQDFQSLSLVSPHVPEKLKLFKGRIILWLKSANQNMLEVIKIPLLAFLLTDALQDNWVKWLKEPNDKQLKPSGPWDEYGELNLSFLYDIFVIAKVRIFLNKHRSISASEILSNSVLLLQMTSEYLMAMEEIAFQELFIVYLNGNSDADFSHLHHELLSLGIIVGWHEEKNNDKIIYRYQFLQQTFKEFLAAIFIMKALCRSNNDPMYNCVKNILVQARYEAKYKVVLSFIRDLYENGSLLIGQLKLSSEFLSFFTSPPDLIGIAQENLLIQVGLSTSAAIEIQELPPLKSNNEIALQKIKSTTEINQLLDKLDTSPIVNYALVCEDISELPDDAPPELINHYCEVMSKLLTCWSYRVKGKVASKLVKTNLKINESMVLPLIQNVLKNSSCYSYERHDAVRVILKCIDLQITINNYLILLDDVTIENEYKNTILICVEKLIDIDPKFNNHIFSVINKLLNCSNYTDIFYQEFLLRRLLIATKIDKIIHSFPDYNTPTLAQTISASVTVERLELLFSLINYKYFTFENIATQIFNELKNYSNRQEVRSYVSTLIEQFNKYKFYNVADWLDSIISAPHDKSIKSIFRYVNTAFNSPTFEPDEGKVGEYYRFWRVDAGIPIAFKFLATDNSKTAFAYLLFQIKFKPNNYDVSRTMFMHLLEFHHNENNRFFYLYLSLEYLVYQNKYRARKSILKLDDDSTLISKLIKSAWSHFISGCNYPLTGIDLIFAIGVTYGLPLIQHLTSFIILFPNLSCDPIVSPSLSKFQLKVACERLKYLSQLCINYQLDHLVNIANRLSDKKIIDASIEALKQFYDTHKEDSPNPSRLAILLKKRPNENEDDKTLLNKVSKSNLISNQWALDLKLPRNPYSLFTQDLSQHTLSKFKESLKLLIDRNYIFDVLRNNQVLVIKLQSANITNLKSLYEKLGYTIYSFFQSPFICDWEVKEDKLIMKLATSQDAKKLKRTLREVGLNLISIKAVVPQKHAIFEI